tara:strand:+ start:366 stop:629 length:264 start_codon:yes stop_codon:yes gene_type:complete
MKKLLLILVPFLIVFGCEDAKEAAEEVSCVSKLATYSGILNANIPVNDYGKCIEVKAAAQDFIDSGCDTTDTGVGIFSELDCELFNP